MRKSVFFAMLICCLCLALPGLGEIVELPVDSSPGLAYDWDKYQTENGYCDPSLSIEVYQDTLYDTEYMYALVKIATPEQLRTAVAYKYNSDYTATALKMAEANNAVLAINADYYSFNDSGHIVRQGHTYRRRAYKEWDVLLIDQNGDFHTLHEPSRAGVAAWLEEHPEITVINSFNFGPVFIENGERTMEKFTDALNSMSIRGHARFARTVICQLDTPLTYLCMTCQGDQDGKGVGFTYEQIYDCLRAIEEKLPDGLKIKTAYNLDGGYSASMIMHGKRINWPENGVNRAIADIIYFASAWQEEEKT